MQNCAFCRKKKKMEREEKLLLRKRDPCQMVQANSTSWLESLTASHPVWVSSKRWDGGLWLQWNNKCRLQRHFIFSECLLLRWLPIWGWMYHTLFLKSWEIWGKERTSEKARRIERKMHWKDLICFWVSDGRAGILGGRHGGSQRILCHLNCWRGWEGPCNRWRGSQRSPMGISRPLMDKASLVAQLVKNQSAMQETWVQSLGWEDPLEKGTATHSRILAWRIPWTGKPGRL